jgi:hypothetical protein
VRSEERLGESDSPGVCVVEIEIGFEELLQIGWRCVSETRGSESICRIKVGRGGHGMPCPYQLGGGIRSGWAFTDRGTEIAAVAHEQQCGDRGKCVKKAEHAALAFADAEGKRFEQRPLQRDPVRRRVHFVFGELELAVTDVLIREEFYFLEADDL